MNSQSSGMFGVGKIPDDWMGEQNDDNENTFGQFPENLDGWFSQDEFLDQAPSFPVATSVTSLISSVENSSDDSKSMDKQSTGSVLPQQSPSQYLHEMHLRHLEQINHSTKSTHYFDRPLDGPRSFLPIDGLADSDGEPEMSRFKGGDDYGSDDSDYSDENGANEELSAPTKLSSTDRKSRKSKRSDGKTIEVLDLNAKAKNREHAKNTRQRKKHYIEALKETVKILSDERERIDRERRIALSRLAEQVTIILSNIILYRTSLVLIFVTKYFNLISDEC